MPKLEIHGISLYYELHGNPSSPPVMLIHGLGGSGKSWGSQVDRFAKNYYVILPDHRGCGQSTQAKDGYTIDQHALDMASLIRHLKVGPAHVVGTSTGGAIGQIMALDHSDSVRSLTLASSFARADAYFTREFNLRKKLMAESDLSTVYSCYAIFLFAPKYASLNPDKVEAWIKRASSAEENREISVKRIDMILAYNGLDQLRLIQKPTLVVCGDKDLCTPIHLSEEIARAIPGSKLTVFNGGGHFIHSEQEEKFFETVQGFLTRN